MVVRLRDRAYPTEFDAPGLSRRLISVCRWSPDSSRWTNVNNSRNRQKRRCKNNLSSNVKSNTGSPGCYSAPSRRPAATRLVSGGIRKNTTRGIKSLNGDNDFYQKACKLLTGSAKYGGTGHTGYVLHGIATFYTIFVHFNYAVSQHERLSL